MAWVGAIAVLVIAIYFLPTMIALSRYHSYRWVIFAVNLAAGWTALGWIVALVWSVWPDERSLIDPVMGNVTGKGLRNAGDTFGAARHGAIRGQIEEVRATKLSRPTFTAPVENQDSVERLERLAALQKSGFLTADEAEYQKRVILGLS